MGLEFVCQPGQLGHAMIVTDGFPCRLPDMFLGVEVGSRWREVHQLQARVGGEYGLKRRPLMPGGAIQEQQDGPVGIGCQNLLKVQGCGLGVHDLGRHDDLMPGVQIERPIEVHAFPARMQLDEWGLTAPVPDGPQRRLKVERGLVLGQDDGIGCFLRRVDQFFSSCSSNSMTLSSERDLYCPAGWW